MGDASIDNADLKIGRWAETERERERERETEREI